MLNIKNEMEALEALEKSIENAQNPTQGEKCDCAVMSCPDNCDRKHTHKKFFCEICEPEAVSKMQQPQGESEDCEKELFKKLRDTYDLSSGEADEILTLIKTEREKARASEETKAELIEKITEWIRENESEILGKLIIDSDKLPALKSFLKK